MAINFLNTVDLNKNQLNNAAIQNLAADPATGVLGQIYYNTTDSVLKICITASTPAPTNAVWQGVSGDVASVTASTVDNRKGIAVVDSAGPDPIVGLNIIGQANLGATPATNDELLIYDLSATTNKSITVGNLVGGFETTYSYLTSPRVPTFDTLVGGTGYSNAINVATTVTPAGGLTMTVDVTVNASNVITAIVINNPGYGYSTGDVLTVSAGDANATFTLTSDSSNVNPNLRLRSSANVNDDIKLTGSGATTITRTSDTGITISSLNTQNTYTLPVTAGAVAPAAPTTGIITLTGSGGDTDAVTFSGTTGRVNVSGGGSTITVDLTDDVTIVDDLTVGGVITQSQAGETNSLASPLNMNSNKVTNIATGTAGTDGVNLAQVELLVAGVGVFQGGYDATNDPGSPNISGGSNVKLDLGDYFVVSHDGDITFSGTTTTGVNSGALANSTALVLTAANTSVAVGMDVTGTGVPPGITIATVTNSTNFVLSSAITIANTTTLTFSDKVVSVEVGDFIFANAAIAAGSDPAASEYTIVQSDANIAGAGATDGATEKGIAGFDSANFTVTASGWVQLDNQKNPYGRRQALNNGANATPATSPSSRVESGGVTTFTLNLADATLFGTGALSENIAVEVTQIGTPFQTVYAEITRSGSASMAIAFTGSVLSDVYQVLLTHV